MEVREMFTVFVHLYLFCYYLGDHLAGTFVYYNIWIVLFIFAMHNAGYVLYINSCFPFGVDIVFIVVAVKQDAVHLDF